jgi:hypothetical protein
MSSSHYTVKCTSHKEDQSSDNASEGHLSQDNSGIYPYTMPSPRLQVLKRLSMHRKNTIRNTKIS